MKRILLIDDNAAVRSLLRTFLERSGFEVAEAAEGDAGIQLYRHWPADLVLCDLFMPGKDGLEAIRQFLREFPGVKVIAMSGGGFGGNLDLLPVAKMLGAVELLYKPFDGETVLEAIRRALQAPTPAGIMGHSRGPAEP